MKTYSNHLIWKDLKEFVNSLDEKFLEEPVRWWGDDRGGIVSSLDILEEDYLTGDEGFYPESTWESDEEFGDEFKDELGLVKGTPILWVD